jgi:predicted metal-dependent hydrolase
MSINKKEIKIQINGKDINCYIEKKKRKSISIKILTGKEISISAPLRVSYEYIEKVIEKKIDWIEETIKKIEKSEFEKKLIENSVIEKYMFLGKEYYINVIREKKAIEFEIIDDTINFYSTLRENKNIIKKWYKKNSEEIFMKRVEIYSKIIGVYPKELKIKELKSSWGICSSSKIITLNRKLLMAPIEVIDYVVIHELCHLKHHNHSKLFWEEVLIYMADYKEKKEWLRKNGIKIEYIAKKIR